MKNISYTLQAICEGKPQITREKAKNIWKMFPCHDPIMFGCKSSVTVLQTITTFVYLPATEAATLGNSLINEPCVTLVVYWPSIIIYSISHQICTGLCCALLLFFSLQWPHNEPTGISTHRRLDCLFNHLFKPTLKETSEPALLTLCEGNHRWPMDSPHKGLVTRKPFPFEDVIMVWLYFTSFCCVLWFISLHSSGYVFYLWLSHVLANEWTHSICNVFSSFLRNAEICESWA